MNKETIVKDYQDYKKIYDTIEDKNSNAALQIMGAMSALEHLCPELKVSDSEKIRKEIIEHIKDQQSSFISAPDCRDKSEEEDNNKYNSWIAWLEKQGEPTDIPADMTNTLKEEYQKGWDAAMRQLPKEVDSQVWQIANNAAKTWEESFSILCTTQKAYDKGKKDALKEQNHAWSKEDELCKENILSVIEFKGYPAEVNWLKSIKDRVQSKQEWSEENEKMIDNIIDYMMPMPIFFTSTKGKSGKEYTKEFIKEAIDWLKSLRPQSTWKPTLEQVDALQIAIENAEHEKEYSNQNALVSLMEDLKKL